ncbi:MAG TPA: GNVR domain-containing protein [Vicinamibacterales bacterium]|jgi:polysaccharide chain length determinant protein (PEP-CTERM system associated)|nr:GNVR domain-containing protein [Vicinamibacterales bacterium]
MPRDMLSPNTDDSLAVRVLEILRRRKILAVTTFMTVLGAALAFALYLPDLYRGTAMVLIERPISESVLKAPVSGELESRLYVIKQEILSRDRLTQLINRFNLYPELRKRAGMEDALTQARNDVVIQQTGPEQVSGRVKTVSFSLSFTGDSRETVAEVTNAIAAFYVAQNTLMRSGEATRTTQFLNAQLSEAKKELDRQERALSAYTTSHVGELPQQVGVNLATLERLNTQLRLNGEQQIRLIEQREKLFDGVHQPGVTARAVDPDASPETIERLKQIEKLKTEMVGLETKTTPRHPDVIRLREQIAALEREAAAAEAAETQKREEAARLAAARAEQAQADAVNGPVPQLRRKTLESLDSELAKLRQEEAGIRQTIGSFEQRLESAPQRQQEYQLITRDWSAAKDLYDSLLRRYEEAQLTASMETGFHGERFRILEPALPPEGPSAPNRMRLMIMGLLLAFAAGVAAVLAREQFDSSFHSVDELREFTTVPVLVSIPPIGPSTIGHRVRMVFATVSAVALIVVVATLSAYIASGNEHLVRLIERAG